MGRWFGHVFGHARQADIATASDVHFWAAVDVGLRYWNAKRNSVKSGNIYIGTPERVTNSNNIRHLQANFHPVRQYEIEAANIGRRTRAGGIRLHSLHNSVARFLYCQLHWQKRRGERERERERGVCERTTRSLIEPKPAGTIYAVAEPGRCDKFIIRVVLHVPPPSLFYTLSTLYNITICCIPGRETEPIKQFTRRVCCTRSHSLTLTLFIYIWVLAYVGIGRPAGNGGKEIIGTVTLSVGRYRLR